MQLGSDIMTMKLEIIYDLVPNPGALKKQNNIPIPPQLVLTLLQ